MHRFSPSTYVSSATFVAYRDSRAVDVGAADADDAAARSFVSPFAPVSPHGSFALNILPDH
jgi:hypothetical protein